MRKIIFLRFEVHCFRLPWITVELLNGNVRKRRSALQAREHHLHSIVGATLYKYINLPEIFLKSEIFRNLKYEIHIVSALCGSQTYEGVAKLPVKRQNEY